MADIAPRTVLDVGCAKGFLVEALRDRGVEAFGLDVSEYAIGEVRPDIRSFCRVASATDPLPRRYDLIVCIEVLEHVAAGEGQLAIRNMCRNTDDILFSSTPDDFDEPTHVNVKPRSFWIERFADQGFHLDLEFDAGFVAPHAMRLRAGGAEVSVVDALLAQGDRQRAELARLRGDLAGKEGVVAAINAELDWLRGDLAARDSVVAAVNAELERLRGDLAARDSVVAAINAELERLRGDLAARDSVVAAVNAELERLRGDLAARDNVVAVINAELARLRGDLAGKESGIAAANARLASLRKAHADSNQTIAVVRGERDCLLADVAALREQETSNLRAIREAHAELEALRASADEAAGRIEHLAAYVRLVHGTISWKMLERARRFRDRLAPEGTGVPAPVQSRARPSDGAPG